MVGGSMPYPLRPPLGILRFPTAYSSFVRPVLLMNIYNIHIQYRHFVENVKIWLYTFKFCSYHQISTRNQTKFYYSVYVWGRSVTFGTVFLGHCCGEARICYWKL